MSARRSTRQSAKAAVQLDQKPISDFFQPRKGVKSAATKEKHVPLSEELESSETTTVTQSAETKLSKTPATKSHKKKTDASDTAVKGDVPAVSKIAEKATNKSISTRVNRQQTTVLKKPLVVSNETPDESPAQLDPSTPKKSEAVPETVTPPLSFVVPVPTTTTPPVSPTKKLRPDLRNNEEDPIAEERQRAGWKLCVVPAVDRTRHLFLPPTFERLYNLFQHCDRVLSILLTQDKRSTFSEVQKNVERVTRSRFTTRDLARILHLYPSVWQVRCERIWQPFGGLLKGDKYELVLEAGLLDDVHEWLVDGIPKGFDAGDTPSRSISPSKGISPCKGRVLSSTFLPIPVSPRKLSPLKRVVPSQREPSTDIRPRLEGWRLSLRVRIFHHLLAREVHRQHADWLKENVKSINLESYPQRWHPDFDLDSVQWPGEAELPRPPTVELREFPGGKPLSASDYLRITTNIPAVDVTSPRRNGTPVKRELFAPSTSTDPSDVTKTKDKDEGLTPIKGADSIETKPAVTEQKPAKQTLLERIRAKEAAKKAALLSEDPVEQKRRGRLELLQKDLLRTITSFYAIRKALSLEVSVVVQNMRHATGAMSPSEGEAIITELANVCAPLLTIVDVRGKKFLKMTTEASFTALKEKLEAALKST